MEQNIVYDIFHLIYWDWRIAVDLFLGGLGVGAFLFALAIMFLKDNDELVAVKIGALVGPIAMSAGLLIMLSEMGQPLRVYKTFTRFNVTSTMSWGGILQEGFVLLSAVFVILLFLRRFKDIRSRFAVFAGFFALLVGLYHGFLLSFVTARPLWNAGAISVGSFLLSVNTGAAAVLLLNSFSGKGRQELADLNHPIKNFLLISLLMQLSTYLIWLVTLMNGKADFVHAFAVLQKHFAFLLWGGAILVGLVVPFLILAAYSTGRRKEKAIPVFPVCLAILLGGLIFRYILVIAGQIS